MNKNNKFYLLFLFNIILFLFFKPLYADNGYLEYDPYCSSNPWDNYPYEPNSSVNCINKRYCSDIKVGVVRKNGFYKCYIENGKCADCNTNEECLETTLNGNKTFLKYKKTEVEEEITLENPCDIGTTYVEVETTDRIGDIEKTNKIIIKEEESDKCKITTMTPVIFDGIPVVVFDGLNIAEYENYDKPAIFYNELGHNGETGTEQNCLLKSCLDLTTEELEAIDYSKNFITQERKIIYNDLKKLVKCMKDKNGNEILDENGKCIEGIEDDDEIFFYKFCEPVKYTKQKNINGNKKYRTNIQSEDEPVYCHEFEDENALKYLWRYGTAYDSANNYHCILHQCPIPDNATLTCESNYTLFSDKSNDYLNKYKLYILKQQEDSNLRYGNCTPLGECINTPRLATLLKCKDNGALNDECDTYVGRDNNLKNTISDEEAQKFGLQQQQSCNNDKQCIKTYDCHFKNETAYKEICADEDMEQDYSDENLSYFYRPVPPSPATEVCPSNNENPSNNKKTCEEGRTIIKRSLRGITDYPLPPNEGGTTKASIFGRFGTEWIKNDNGSRPDGNINYFNNNRLCASADGFRQFENYIQRVWAFGIKTTYHHGKYYDGFWRITEPGKLPHILPLCNTSNLGIKGSGREYMCGNSGNICNVPYWDSYYIKGYPTYAWKDKEANVKTVSVRACLRQKNTGELGVCGGRECRVDCAFATCAFQWCGIDRCVTLTSNIGEECSVDNNNDKCAKEVTNSFVGGSSVRFRLQALDRKAYVFLDASSLGCNDTTEKQNAGMELYHKPGSDQNSIGGTIGGKLSSYSLYDDNSLTDNNCDGQIDDRDIFGEYLYKVWNCDVLTKYEKATEEDRKNLKTPKLISNNEWCNEKKRSEDEVNLNCKAMRVTGSNNDPGNILENDYITWDIVQYQGNNQNIDKFEYDFINNPIFDLESYYKVRDFCKIGELDRCRGYFDKDNNFIKEQQAFILPIATSPNFFYKYATIDNTPDLFLPLLNIFSVKEFGNSDYTILSSTTNYDDLFLDFFNPSIIIKYGDRDIKVDGKNDDRLTIPFEKKEISGIVETTYGTENEPISTGYSFKKSGSLYPEPSAKVCLYQILVEGKEQLVKCLNRKNPPISNFLIKPYQIDIKEPTVRAYFHKDTLDNSQTINLNNETKFIYFYNNNNDLYIEQNKNLKAPGFAYGQNYPILLESSYCSKLYYECVFYQKDYDQKLKNNATKDELEDLKNKINLCDININFNCKNQNGNENIVLKTEGNDNYLIKVKENPDAIGAYNQICVTSGFENYEKYVKAMPTKNGVVGKCILTLESKKKEECRKKIHYEYCSTKGGDCVCLDGTNTCNCSNNSCVKKIDCSCNDSNSCKLLPEGCFLSGFNANNSVLDKDNKLISSCACEETTSASTGTTIRKSTPREMGLCVDLIDINFCEPVKYYNKNGTYFDGGDGKYLSQIRADHYSNVWRTEQKQLGKTYMGNFGHAEFEKATDCNGLPDDFCTLTKRCYSTAKATKGQVCQYGEANCKCDDLVQTGVCNGFWKNKYNTIPLAKCNTLSDVNGEKYGIFKLISGTSCERYSCPTISDANSPTGDEIIESANATENSISTINTEGKSNGFASWSEYKKGTYAVSAENIEKDIENGYGDELEQREALHCLQGYGPAGSNVAIKNYIPLSRIDSGNIINTGSISDIDNIVKNMLGYNLYIDNETSSFSTKSYKADNITELNNYNNVFKNYYSAKDYLPVRYCSQMGNWMGVDDIYNKYKVNPYYTTNTVFHKPNLTDSGFINNTTINSHNIPTSQKNTYNDSIDYSKKYCERLTCQSIKENDIGLLSVENSIPENKLQYENLQNINYNVAYPNTTENNNYPKVANNPNDKRTNTIYNNKYTYWRHTGGATWSETPAPRKVVEVDVTGTCHEKAGFYPHGVNFLPTFQAQYNTISFDKNEKNIKDYSFRNGIADEVNPTRTCNKWGLWSEVSNKCQATCEAIDVFRTNFNDINNDNKLQNFEITGLYKNPKFRDDYLSGSKGVVKYGDKFTGGAKWPRSVAGTVVIGECDATVGKDNNYSNFPSNGIQFVRNSGDLKYQGAPYRECQEDGTWGPIQNPCINFTTCQDVDINNSAMYSSSNINNDNIVVSLSGGSILPDSSSYQTIFSISTDCSNNPSYESGKIIKNCDISTGDWQSGFVENSCVLKSCGDVSYKIGDISVVDYKKGINNLYYPSNSGLKGQIGNYLGNNFTQQCPTGYYCNNCDNEKLTYTCQLDDSNSPVWYRKGECVPYVCTFDSLNMLTLIPSSLNRVSSYIKPTMNDRIRGGNYYIRGDEEEYKPTIYATGKTGFGDVILNTEKIYGTSQYATSGTVLEKSISCRSGYYSSDDKIKFTCNSTSITGPGTWTATVNMTCQEVRCSKFSETVSNGTYTLTQNGTCDDSNSSNVCRPGAKYSLSCNSGYTKDGDKTWTCGTNGEWVSSGSGWCGENCSDTEVTIKICTNNGSSACYYDYDPSGACNLSNNEDDVSVPSGKLNHGDSICKSKYVHFTLYAGAHGGGADWSCKDSDKNVSYKVTCNNGKVSVSKCY